MSLVPRTWSAAGLAAASGAAVFLAQSGTPVLDVPGGGILPFVGILAGAGLGLLGLLRANPGAALGGAGLLVAGTSLVRLGLPGLLEWGAAVAGAVGLVLFLEPLLVADRADALRTRLTEAGEANTDADPDALAERTVELRMSQVRKTLVLASALVVGALLVGTVLRGLLPGAIPASLELDSLYGAVLWVALAIVGLALAQWLRARGAEDEA